MAASAIHDFSAAAQLPPGRLSAIMSFATEIHGYLAARAAENVGPPQLLAVEAKAAALVEITRALREEAEAALARVPVWDGPRLAGLYNELGESGLKDLLRLFHADMPFLIGEISSAIAAADAATAEHGLAAIHGAASNLGLAALSAFAMSFRQRPLEAAIPARLTQELARARFVPPHKTAA